MGLGEVRITDLPAAGASLGGEGIAGVSAIAQWRYRRQGRLPQGHLPGNGQGQRRKRQNPYLHTQIGVSEFNLDDDLLSHGETPHYHRRCIVSLLSSGWDQVVPMLYGRQEIL